MEGGHGDAQRYQIPARDGEPCVCVFLSVDVDVRSGVGE